ncbi:unnamed protein product [Spirodela intermedia]|uniref:Uncharacterized protein n=2 Tax=Spirodela intermedia TaxID=51605 RepID=A0A7I8K7E9_SPIIN|nr:unnamed protein product [Spirodela intermedia]CAA6656907.1 unnamed protein product [Spirodela intermedia]CAA7392863.1 unnamed protein product [Spirodela intermedia]
MQTEDHDTFGVEVQTVRKIKELRHKVQELISPHSVRAKAADSLKRKAIRHEQEEQDSCSSGPRFPASLLFRSGLRTRNEHKLRRSRELTHNID